MTRLNFNESMSRWFAQHLELQELRDSLSKSTAASAPTSALEPLLVPPGTYTMPVKEVVFVPDPPAPLESFKLRKRIVCV